MTSTSLTAREVSQTLAAPLGLAKIEAAFSALDHLGAARRALREAAKALNAMIEPEVAAQVSGLATEINTFEDALEGLLRDGGAQH